MGEGVTIMARTKNSISKITKTTKPEKHIKKCIKCQQEKEAISNFHISFSSLHGDNRVPVCKQCLYKMYDEKYDGNNAHSVIQEIMKLIDKPYLYNIVQSSIENIKTKTTPMDTIFKVYMKNVVMKQHHGKIYENSEFHPEQLTGKKSEDVRIVEVEPQKQDRTHSAGLIEKWGDYPFEEIELFEKKYQQLKINYPERTAMHIEALQIYVRYRVKEELATQKGTFKEAEAWGKLAKEAATAAKINPSQLSKADLSDGLDSFSQLVRSVEQAVDIVDILPKFKERPKDKADFTIWCYINYIRDLKGLPLAKYKDVYEFYEERKKEYASMEHGDDEYGEF